MSRETADVPTCEWCHQPYADVPGCTAKEAAHTEPYEGHVLDGAVPCRDCNVQPGHQHHPGCCLAMCGSDDMYPQQILCGCQFCEPVTDMLELAFLADDMADPDSVVWNDED